MAEFIYSHGLVQDLENYLDDQGGAAKVSVVLKEVFRCKKVPPKESDGMLRKMLAKDDRFLVENGQVFLNNQDDLPVGDLKDMRFVVMDFETTGCGPDARAMEIGLVAVEKGELVAEYDSLLNPDQFVPPFIQRMTGIKQKMLKKAPRFEEVHEDVADFISGAVLVAHNLPFDRAFLWREFHRVDGRIPNHPAFCTLALARKLLPKDQKKGVDALAELWDVEVENRHRALGDARATAIILLKLLEMAEGRGVETMCQLQDLLHGKLVAESE